MASKAMSFASDSHDLITPLACSENERPPLSITPLGLEAALEVPPLDVLMKRKGTKGLQQCLDELTYLYFQKYGWDWIYANAKVNMQHKLYFIRLSDGETRYMGNFRNALTFLMSYVETGKPNDALRRAR